MSLGLALMVSGSAVSYGVGMLSNYANYRLQKRQLKHQRAVARANAKTMTDNANAALDALSRDEGVLSREHDRRLAEIETAYATAGVSSASVSAQDVYARQVETNVEEKWAMRKRTDDAVGSLVLDRDNMLKEAEYAYAWGRRSARYNAVFDAIGQTSGFLANLGMMSMLGGAGGASAVTKGVSLENAASAFSPPAGFAAA